MPAAYSNFCLFVQLAPILGTCSAACADRLDLAYEAAGCSFLDTSSGGNQGCLPCATLEPHYAEASVTSPSWWEDHITGWKHLSPFSGHWRAAVMPAAYNHFCLFVQSVSVAKTLLVSGDVELNRGHQKLDPTKQNSDVLAAVQQLTNQLDERHDALIQSIDEVKANQKLLESKVLDITTRLTGLEKRVNSFEDFQDVPHVQEMVATIVRSEHASLQARLDDYEDRSRRENLIFHGIHDSVSETWADCEEKVRSILATTLSLQLPDEAIARAHRLGTFAPNRTRPVVVRFTSFKTKDSVLSQKAKFRDSETAISEDFCKATRTTRKKLIDFAKATGRKFSLKYNKVVIDSKIYTYCAVSDRVCEIETDKVDPSFHPNRDDPVISGPTSPLS